MRFMNKTKKRYELIKNLIKNNKRDILKILDLGSGSGDLWKDKPERWKVVAVDRFVETKNVNIFYNEDIFDFLNGIDELYDVIICSEVIEHVENPHLLLRLIKKRLKIDGKMILTTPNNSFYVSRISYLLFGRPHHFFSKSSIKMGHITIIPLFHLEYMLSKHFSWKKYYVDGSLMIPFLFDIDILPKSDLTSDIVVYECKRK